MNNVHHLPLTLMILAAGLLHAYDFEPGAVIHKHPVSRSQWLWNAQSPVRDGAKCYYRLHLKLTESPRNGQLAIHYDDGGRLFVNGKLTNERDWWKRLRKGTNLLAFEVTNGFSAAGLLFYGQLNFPSGKTLDIHSDQAVKASATAPDAWNQPAFDDSLWPAALCQGDVLASPWSRWINYVPQFTTPEEKAQIIADRQNASTLPEGIEKEQPPHAKIAYEGGQPKISVNGTLLPPILHLGSMQSPYEASIAIKFRRFGIRIFQIGIGDLFFYQEDGSYDFRQLDQSARRLLHVIPDAYLTVSFRSGAMDKWCRKHPSEIIRYADGPVDPKARDERLHRAIRPSPASKAFQQEILRELQALADFIRAQPWANRVIGFRTCYGIYTEWHTYGMTHGPDVSAPMTRRFRDYLTAKYQNTPTLQRAWKNQDVTLDNAQVPNMSQRTTPAGIMLDPVNNRQTLDYYDCHANIMADLLLSMAGKLKENFPHRLCGAYYGYVFTSHTPEGANVLLDKVLASPHIDYLSDPSFYGPYSRQAGGGFLHRTIPSTHRRYGKLAIIEDDSRFHQLPQYTEKGNATRTPEESYAVIIRNYMNQLFNHSGWQINDACAGSGTRPHTFDDPVVLRGLKDAQKIMKRVGNIPLHSGNRIAMVYDYRQRIRRDGNPNPPWLVHLTDAYTHQHLNRAGVALDIMTLQDFLATDTSSYTCFIFPNLYSPTPQQKQALRSKIRHHGITAIYLTAPGSVTSDGFSDQAMSDFTGISLIGSGTAPQVRCIDPQARTLVGNSVRKILPDGSRAIFLPAPCQDANQWHQLLKAAGCHLYTAPGSYFRRHGDIFMFHTGTKGTHRITLPEDTGYVTELLSGRKYPANRILLKTETPATWVFRLDR